MRLKNIKTRQIEEEWKQLRREEKKINKGKNIYASGTERIRRAKYAK